MAVSDLSLVIDAAQQAETIASRIRAEITTRSAEGVILGLSGGVDSAVVAALSVRAAGTEHVEAYYLYDRDSSKASRARARLAADRLGINLNELDITPAIRKMKIYSPLIMRITALSGAVNRILAGMNRWFRREPFFVSTLRQSRSGRGGVGRFIYERTVGRVEDAFNARHQYRRRFLEDEAAKTNCLLVGAANRSEWMVGWFVKDGIDDVPFSPIIHLYKTQVFQLAECLEVPTEIRWQNPSPDMLKGVTDESALGLTYETIDRILASIERGLSEQQIIAAGVEAGQLSLVRTMNELSQWKRTGKNPASSSAATGCDADD